MGEDDRERRGKRPPRRITARYLSAVTTRYLERYATSRAHLRRLLMRRVHESARFHEDQEVGEGAALVDAELDRLERLGWLDDGRFARDRAKVLHRRGQGSRKIRAALRTKGVDSEVIDEALQALGDELGDPDWQAALTYARKRRIGPWRRAPVDREGERKELGKLARAGFSFEVARRVVELEPDERP